MHSLVFVLVPSTTANITATVAHLLAGSDTNPDKLFPSYTLRCACIGSAALFESYRIFEATPQGNELRIRLRQARANDDETTVEQLLLQRFSAARVIAQELATYRQPDPTCDACQGTGIAYESSDPKYHWDGWAIGGRWSGLFTDLPSQVCADVELQGNIARVRDLPADLVPAAIVTPEGDWHTGPIVMEDELFEAHRDEEELGPRKAWEHQAYTLLGHYPEHAAVVVDCHS